MADQRFTCSQCKARLVLAGGEEGLCLSGSRSEGSGVSAKLEASFLLLEEASSGRGQPAAHAGALQQRPGWRRAAACNTPTMDASLVGTQAFHICHALNFYHTHFVLAAALPPGGPTGQAARRLEESFVVLPGGPAAAQSALFDGAPGASGGGSSTASGSSVVQRVPFDAKLRALARVFEAASGATRVDFPLCADCASEVHRELEAQLAELQQVRCPDRLDSTQGGARLVLSEEAGAGARAPKAHPRPPRAQEVAAYEAALARLEAEGVRPLEEQAFQARLAEAEAEAQHERCGAARLSLRTKLGPLGRGLEEQRSKGRAVGGRARPTCRRCAARLVAAAPAAGLPPAPARRDRLAAAERELAAAHDELAQVQERSAELSGQEGRYWQAFNDFQLRLAEHLDERDALAHRWVWLWVARWVGRGRRGAGSRRAARRWVRDTQP